MVYCSRCGGRVIRRIPVGDNRLRDVCQSCSHVFYQNPKIVAGCLPIYQHRVLMCRRAIEPRKGFWTLPGGFMELGETLEQAAERETMEEAGAQVVDLSLYTLFNLTRIGQLSVFFRARMESSEYHAGVESEAVDFFSESQIPWDELAFTTVTRTLRYYFEDVKTGNYSQRMDGQSCQLGSSPE